MLFAIRRASRLDSALPPCGNVTAATTPGGAKYWTIELPNLEALLQIAAECEYDVIVQNRPRAILETGEWLEMPTLIIYDGSLEL